MISPTEIQAKTSRLYPKFVKSWLIGESFFPRRIPADLNLSVDLSKAKREVDLLREKSKGAQPYSYTIQWEGRNSRTHGLNQFPVSITLESQEDLLSLAGKSQEFAKLERATSLLRSNKPDLESWLLESTHWKELLAVADRLNDLLLLVQYLLDNPQPNCFVREIPLPVSTKLVEENKRILAEWLDRLRPPDQVDFRFSRDEFAARYGLKYPRTHILLRILDPQLQNELDLRFDELSLPTDFLDQLQPNSPIVFIVENKVNLLTLPLMKNTLAIGGIGRAISLLREVHWLHDAKVIYWGDLDVEGFEMLSQCREMFEQTKSFLMDLKTVQGFSDLAIEWQNISRSVPKMLDESELAAYHSLLQKRLRLEQERIPQAFVLKSLREMSLIQ